MDKFEQAIRNGLAQCLKDGHEVNEYLHDTITEYILKAHRGELEDQNEIIYKGFRLIRKTGKEMGRRGSAQHGIGWVVIDIESEETVLSMPPTADNSVSLKWVKEFTDQKREYFDLLKAKGKYPPKKGT